MKIRMDFITNSSSSSFIFKPGGNKKWQELKTDHTVMDMLKMRYMEENKDWLDRRTGAKQQLEWKWERIEAQLNAVVGTPFETNSLEDVMEVFCWYEDDLRAEILKTDQHPKLKFLFILDFYELCIYYSFVFEQDQNRIKKALEKWGWNGDDRRKNSAGDIRVDYELIKSCIWDLMDYFSDKSYGQHYLDHIEDILTGVEECDGRTLGSIIEELFDAEALYYNDFEIHYMIESVLREFEICDFTCCHMG